MLVRTVALTINLQDETVDVTLLDDDHFFVEDELAEHHTDWRGKTDLHLEIDNRTGTILNWTPIQTHIETA